MDVNKIIEEQFINAVKEKYGEILRIGYEYDELSDVHYVWHTSRELEYYDPGFRKFTGVLLNRIFDNYEISNFAFNYDAEKSRTT